MPLYYGVIPSLCRTEHCHALPSPGFSTTCFARTNLGESLPGQCFTLECQNEGKPNCADTKLSIQCQNYSNPGAAFTRGNNSAPLLSYTNQSHAQTRQTQAPQCLNPTTRSTQCQGESRQCPNEGRQYPNEAVSTQQCLCKTSLYTTSPTQSNTGPCYTITLANKASHCLNTTQPFYATPKQSSSSP